MQEKITVYKNFLPEDYFKKIQSISLDELNMPWFFLESVSGMEDFNDTNLQYGFFHVIFNDAPNSFLFDKFYPIIEIMKNNYEIDVFNLKRMRLGMQVKISDKSIVNFPHTDYDNDHMVMLMYLNDSDGDTIFYNDDKKVIRSIEPSENTAVLFDGKILHSSSTPSKNSRRVALNINFNFC